MNNRVKELRGRLGLSQETFGEKLGLSKSAISNIESGRYNLTDTVLITICNIYNVNENWLRTGEGDIFNELSLAEKLSYQYELTETQKVFVSQLMALSPEKKKIIDELILNIHSELKKGGY